MAVDVVVGVAASGVVSVSMIVVRGVMVSVEVSGPSTWAWTGM